MQCPVCVGVNLVMTDRQGIEIDYCPQCRGVWLDRGELDKIIERTRADGVGARAAKDREPDSDRRGYRGSDHDHRKKSWLSEIFD